MQMSTISPAYPPSSPYRFRVGVKQTCVPISVALSASSRPHHHHQEMSNTGLQTEHSLPCADTDSIESREQGEDSLADSSISPQLPANDIPHPYPVSGTSLPYPGPRCSHFSLHRTLCAIRHPDRLLCKNGAFADCLPKVLED